MLSVGFQGDTVVAFCPPQHKSRDPGIETGRDECNGSWLDCPAGIAASERTEVPRIQVQEVKSDKPGVRVFVVHGDKRLACERAEREKAMTRVRAALDSLAQRVNTGKLKAPEKIGAAAARTLACNHGYRYHDWKLQDGRFACFEHPINLQREKSLEGKYLIQTEEQKLSALEAVAVYKELIEVERAFARLAQIHFEEQLQQMRENARKPLLYGRDLLDRSVRENQSRQDRLHHAYSIS